MTTKIRLLTTLFLLASVAPPLNAEDPNPHTEEPPLVMMTASVSSGKVKHTEGIQLVPTFADPKVFDTKSLQTGKDRGYAWLLKPNTALTFHIEYLPEGATHIGLSFGTVGLPVDESATDLRISGPKRISGPAANPTISLDENEVGQAMRTGRNLVVVDSDTGKLGLQDLKISYDIIYELRGGNKPVRLTLLSPVPAQSYPASETSIVKWKIDGANDNDRLTIYYLSSEDKERLIPGGVQLSAVTQMGTLKWRTPDEPGRCAIRFRLEDYAAEINGIVVVGCNYLADPVTANLRLIDSNGKVALRVPLSGRPSNDIEATFDRFRRRLWVLDESADDAQIRRFDIAGRTQESQQFATTGRFRSIALDPITGSLWGATTQPEYYDTFILNEDDFLISRQACPGYQIDYDVKSRSFWIATDQFEIDGPTKLTKVGAADHKVRFSKAIAGTNFRSFVGVDANTGCAWVTMKGNVLCKLSPDGSKLLEVNLEDKVALRDRVIRSLYVEPATGRVWMTLSDVIREPASSTQEARRKRYFVMISPEGQVEPKLEVPVGALEMRPSAEVGYVWVVTTAATLKLDSQGTEVFRVQHENEIDEAWVVVP